MKLPCQPVETLDTRLTFYISFCALPSSKPSVNFPVTMRPETEWLERRWGITRNAAEIVEHLLEAEENGSTALQHFHHKPDWGNALTALDLATVTPQQVAAIQTPLVISYNQTVEFLQSSRLFQTEYDIRLHLHRAARAPDIPIEEEVHKGLDALFSTEDPGGLQRKAVELALRRNLCWITGGPGTGKTTTLARILVATQLSGNAGRSIFLAAPTGKAAQRMRSAVSAALEHLPESFTHLQPSLIKVANSCCTLHSLLKYNPARRTCGRDRFPTGSVIVVDECSMMDVYLWRALLKAVPPDAKLILLGDPQQLESVGQGSVLEKLVDLAQTEPFGRMHVHLTHSWRFMHRSGIGALATALQSADVEATLQVLEQHRSAAGEDGLSWLDTCADKLRVEQFPQSIKSALHAVAIADSPESALNALDQVCILTAHRGHLRSGAETVSRKIEQFLLQSGPLLNEPIIINRNDPETGLRNGTLGILAMDAQKRRRAWFRNTDGSLRELPLLRLPDYSPAWAITIHRSQGSEYNEVLVLLPNEDSPLANRSLLYTAITRAKHAVHVVGEPAVMRKAVQCKSERRCLVNEPLYLSAT